MSRRKTSHQSTSELTDYYPTAEVFVDSLLIVNALSTATVISGRNISPRNTSKFNHYDRTAEVIVDTERPVNREGNNIKSCLYRVARESKIPEHICVHPAELPYPCIWKNTPVAPLKVTLRTNYRGQLRATNHSPVYQELQHSYLSRDQGTFERRGRRYLQVIDSQIEVRPTVRVTSPIIVEENWEEMMLTERRR